MQSELPWFRLEADRNETLRICVAAVGRIRQREWLTLAEDYAARINHYAKCEVVELKDDNELLTKLPKGDFVVALEVGGHRLTSTDFAGKLQTWSRRGQGRIVFAIGGSEGLPRAISQNADYQLSLSDMTLPHRLARVVLLEQLYRAQTILRGEPYAREG
jgi:23S rRNA (pseudouridine1915-N3)-methyltransferase